MVEVWGFCITGRVDEPLDAERFCLPHHMVGIPPTWGRRTQRWTDGAWSPHIEKPANYVYRPKFTDEPQTVVTSTPSTHTCQWCGVSFKAPTRGGSPPAYCTSIHRMAALNARRRAARGAAS